MEGGDDEVDRFDADERQDEAAQPVNQEIAPQQRRGADRPVGDAPQSQGNQGDDDERVEDDRREDR
jgi:hypothetical protein